MPIGKDFTKEQWKEIDDARARLEAYRLTYQPYPPYIEETKIPEKEIKPAFRPRKIHQELDEAKAEVKHMHLEIDRLKSKQSTKSFTYDR